jgi:ribonuclease D
MSFNVAPRRPALLQGDLSAEAHAQLQRAGRIAWDIETTGLDWNIAKIGTCQLSCPDLTVIVQVGPEVPERLRQLLGDATVLKVFHHAPFDLRFMTTAWKTPAAGVACTKVASKLLNPDSDAADHSLQSLMAKYLGVHLEKGAVRTSDWSSSHLTDEQLLYATRDVADLLRLYDLLRDRLRRYGLLPLYESCVDFLPTRVELEVGNWPDVFAY